jgi:glycosyltransferase involved in cell wall biosynthesis
MPTTLILVENASVPTDPRVWPQCRSLRAAGWDVVVVCPKGRARDTADLDIIDGVEIHRFSAPESGGGVAGYIREYGIALSRIRYLVRDLARRRRFDVVHACNPPDFLLLAARAVRRRGAATIFDHHDLSPELYVGKFGRGKVGYLGLLAAERVGFMLADVVLSANESFREIALRRGHKSPPDVFVVRNGPDVRVFRPVEPNAELRGMARHIIGYVGLMGTQDGVDEAIRALAELRRRRNDWHAVFVGEGPAAPAAQALVTHLGIDANVTFTGFVDDRNKIAEIISSCDVCLSPEPRSELNERSTLIKVAEYMAAGCPVVAHGLLETRRTAGETAAYSATDDPNGLASAIDTLLDDEPRRRAMSQAAVRRAATLAWDESEPVLLRAYETALARSRVARDAKPHRVHRDTNTPQRQ